LFSERIVHMRHFELPGKADTSGQTTAVELQRCCDLALVPQIAHSAPSGADWLRWCTTQVQDAPISILLTVSFRSCNLLHTAPAPSHEKPAAPWTSLDLRAAGTADAHAVGSNSVVAGLDAGIGDAKPAQGRQGESQRQTACRQASCAALELVG
jgi:hypothetical protein